MKLNYQNDILKYVSEKQLEKRESIVKKWNEVPCGLATNCFDCEMREIIRDGMLGRL